MIYKSDTPDAERVKYAILELKLCVTVIMASRLVPWLIDKSTLLLTCIANWSMATPRGQQDSPQASNGITWTTENK